MLTTDQIANRLVELVRAGQNQQAYEELFADDAVSAEPAHTGIPDAVGKSAILEKLEMLTMMIMEMYGSGCSDPVVAGRYFSCSMWMDAEMMGRDRAKIEEIALYETREGKIIRESFFF